MDLYLHENDTFMKPELKFEHVNVGYPCIKNEPLDIQIKEEEFIEGVASKVVIENDILMDIKEELPTTSSDLEHDYCHEILKTEDDADVSVTNFSLLDHSYSLPYKDCNESSPNEKTNEDKLDNSVQQGNNLIFGLDESYRDDKRQEETDLSKSKVSRIRVTKVIEVCDDKVSATLQNAVTLQSDRSLYKMTGYLNIRPVTFKNDRLPLKMTDYF